MSTTGIKPGDVVMVIEHRGEQQLVFNALVVSFSMDTTLSGTKGEPAIQAIFVDSRDRGLFAVRAHDVVHISHRNFLERDDLGYEELPPTVNLLIAWHADTAREIRRIQDPAFFEKEKAKADLKKRPALFGLRL